MIVMLYSDGVTTIKKSLFNIIQEWIDPKYTDEQLKLAADKYQHCPPNSKESLYYRYAFYTYVFLNSNVLQGLRLIVKIDRSTIIKNFSCEYTFHKNAYNKSRFERKIQQSFLNF